VPLDECSVVRRGVKSKRKENLGQSLRSSLEEKCGEGMKWTSQLHVPGWSFDGLTLITAVK
jgi:hypothetical protein